MLRLGDRVRIRCPGHWADGQTGVIVQLHVLDPNTLGHRVQIARGYEAVIRPDCLERLTRR